MLGPKALLNRNVGPNNSQSDSRSRRQRLLRGDTAIHQGDQRGFRQGNSWKPRGVITELGEPVRVRDGGIPEL